jgi:carbonic anhydrase/acetyltransferase-like protein (isoleucine patch superfamily)
MLIEHAGRRPRIHPTASVAPTAVVSGDVEIGAGSRVLHGAVVTADGAPVRIGERCVIMEQAVVRGAGGRRRSFPVRLGDLTLVGPHAYVVGADVGRFCFIATSAMVFNGSRLADACTVTLGAMVHLNTTLEEGQRVPIQHVAIGTPATIFDPSRGEEMMAALARENFMASVFGVETAGRSRADVMAEAIGRYSSALAAHDGDVVLDGT